MSIVSNSCSSWKFYKFYKFCKSNTRHVSHVLLMLSFIFASVLVLVSWHQTVIISPLWSSLGWLITFSLYLIRIVAFLTSLPYGISVFLGLFLYNPFLPTKNQSIKPTKQLICFRVATRGNNPTLVKNTVTHNLSLIRLVGLKNFKYEVVTNMSIVGLPTHAEVSEIVVPNDYQTTTGALFKARSLQYAIAKCTDFDDKDWIVHLDEETLLTTNSLHGIAEFIESGRHPFGQGAVTYSNHIQGIVNWTTTLIDMSRIADDMGKIQAQFKLSNLPIFSMKGSFVVAQVRAEREISFENGPAGSIAEDCWFTMKAYDAGHTFDWIEGEMEEFSPFSVWDLVLQRRRWFHGIFLVIYAGESSFRTMFWLIIDFHHRFFEPFEMVFSTINWCWWEFLPIPIWMQVMYSGNTGVQLYMYVFGIFKSAHCSKNPTLWSKWRILGLCILSVLFIRPLHIALNTIATVLAMMSVWESNMEFYLVKKEK